MKWVILRVVEIKIILFALIVISLLFIMGCDINLGEIEEVEVGIRCDEISMAGAMLGDSVDTAISEICKDACLSNVMKYSPNYRCHTTSLKLICSCKVTPEREEQLRIINERDETKELNNKCESICEPECKRYFDTYEPPVGEPFYLSVPIDTRDDVSCHCGCMNRGLWVDTKAVKN
jgi:hypothetical protein|tara:strand:- start:13 stop:543 length:531 start_codon:yes stop_codon:yes gene_type:complete